MAENMENLERPAAKAKHVNPGSRSPEGDHDTGPLSSNRAMAFSMAEECQSAGSLVNRHVMEQMVTETRLHL